MSDGETLTTQFMVAATGFLSQRRVPVIPGNGRRTAVIGTGFTGAQVIPELAKEVSALSGYQHTRIGMLPESNSVFLLAVQRLEPRITPTAASWTDDRTSYTAFTRPHSILRPADTERIEPERRRRARRHPTRSSPPWCWPPDSTCGTQTCGRIEDDRTGGSVGISASYRARWRRQPDFAHGNSMTSGHIPVAAWFTRQCWPFAYRETRRWGRPPCSRWNG